MKFNPDLGIQWKEYQWISLIYEAAADPSLWPNLLKLFNDHYTLDSLRRDHPDLELTVLEKLEPHIQKALTINDQIDQLVKKKNIQASLVNHFPIGVLLVDQNNHIIVANKKAQAILAGFDLITIHHNQLAIEDPEKNEALAHAIHQAIRSERAKSSSIIRIHSGGDKELSVSMLVTQDILSVDESRNALIFIATPVQTRDISEQALVRLFDLSAAEARVAKALACGDSLETIAERFYVSKHTVRSQIKNIYRKTNTQRQAELVTQILTSPAVWDINQEFIVAEKKPDNPVQDNQAFLNLDDGRKLSYALYGKKDGWPVLYFHGQYGCRTQYHPDTAILDELGVTLITPDRPGYGMSDVNPSPSFHSWCNDVEQLLDHLGLDKVAVVGFTTGGSYATAAAYLLQHRIVKLININGYPPLSSYLELDGLMSNEKIFLSLARHSPKLFKLYTKHVAHTILRNPTAALDKTSEAFDDVDMRVLADADVRENFENGAREGFRYTIEGLTTDLLLITHDWQIDLSGDHLEMEYWFGERSRMVQPQMVRYLKSLIPDMELKSYANGGHLLVYQYWRDIMAAAISGFQSSAPSSLEAVK